MIEEMIVSSHSVASAVVDPHVHVEELDRRLRVEMAIAELPYPDRIVVVLRYGFDGPRFTLREIGWLLCLTSERVRQIQARAIRRLRGASRRTGIRDYARAEES